MKLRIQKVDQDKCGIYKIENLVNAAQYVGSAVCFRRRFATHRSLLNRGLHENQHLQREHDVNVTSIRELIAGKKKSNSYNGWTNLGEDQ